MKQVLLAVGLWLLTAGLAAAGPFVYYGKNVGTGEQLYLSYDACTNKIIHDIMVKQVAADKANGVSYEETVEEAYGDMSSALYIDPKGVKTEMCWRDFGDQGYIVLAFPDGQGGYALWTDFAPIENATK